jgi:hypothetical protein
MKYECKICEYVTDKKSNLERHNKTKKHMSNVENTSCINEIVKPKVIRKVIRKVIPKVIPKDDDKKYHCKYCDEIFSAKTNMYRHIRNYHKNDDNNKDIKIKNLEEQNNEILKQNEELLRAVTKNAETANITAKSNKKTVHIMTHAMKNFSDAPIIQQLSHNKSKNLLTEHAKDSTHSVEDLMIHNQENGILHKYLGNMLVTHYRNVEDPSQQPLWSSDTARLNFILKQVVGDSSEWVNDKKGIKFNKLVVEPILNKVKDMLLEKITELIKENTNINIEMEKMENNMYKILHCRVIISDITKEILHTNIIKYICPYLNFEKSDDKKPKKKNKTKIIKPFSESDSEDKK